MTRNLHLVPRLPSGLCPLIMRRLPSTVNSRSSRRMPANSTLILSVPSLTKTSVLGIQCVSPAGSRRPPAVLRTYSDELTLHMLGCVRTVSHAHKLCKLLLTRFDEHLRTLPFSS